mgnify:CR=1 FL=1
MSRSYKKNPFAAICKYKSNKWDKVKANKKFRRLNKLKLIAEKEPLKSIREVSDVWDFTSDGLASYVDKHCYDWLLRKGYSQEECDKLYSKLFRK